MYEGLEADLESSQPWYRVEKVRDQSTISLNQYVCLIDVWFEGEWGGGLGKNETNSHSTQKREEGCWEWREGVEIRDEIRFEMVKWMKIKINQTSLFFDNLN